MVGTAEVGHDSMHLQFPAARQGNLPQAAIPMDNINQFRLLVAYGAYAAIPVEPETHSVGSRLPVIALPQRSIGMELVSAAHISGEALQGDFLGHRPGRSLLLLKGPDVPGREPVVLRPQQPGPLLQIPGPVFHLPHRPLARIAPGTCVPPGHGGVFRGVPVVGIQIGVSGIGTPGFQQGLVLQSHHQGIPGGQSRSRGTVALILHDDHEVINDIALSAKGFRGNFSVQVGPGLLHQMLGPLVFPIKGAPDAGHLFGTSQRQLRPFLQRSGERTGRAGILLPGFQRPHGLPQPPAARKAERSGLCNLLLRQFQSRFFCIFHQNISFAKPIHTFLCVSPH